jgi:hypothetical protein
MCTQVQSGTGRAGLPDAATSGKALLGERRLGDLNPGWARTQTALAARVVAVWIGSGWTNVLDRSSPDGAAPW